MGRTRLAASINGATMADGERADSAGRMNEALREAEILRSGALFVGRDPRLNALVERAAARFGTAMAAVTIIHGGWQHVIAAVGMPSGTYPRSESFCGHAILDPAHVMCVPDATADERFRRNPNVTGRDRIRFYAGAPIVSGGQPLGALCVFGPEARDCLDTDEEEELQALAAETVATISAVARDPARSGH